MKVKNVEIKSPHFRKGTFTELREVVFDMKMPKEKTAAMGDMIAWMPAIKFVAESYNYIAGHLIVPKYFLEVARNIMAPHFPKWRVHTDIPERMKEGWPLKQPLMHPVNATGMHLLDLGFTYFAGINPVPPEAAHYCRLNFDGIDRHFKEGFRYAVMTPGATAINRTMLPSTYNHISKYLLSKGITPVHLGRSSMEDRIGHGIDPRYDLSVGINLIDHTTLMEAANIMRHATMVLGIDNGLLHLAGLTDVTLIFCYTIAGPDQRRINRKGGHLIELYADKESLPCLFCQENVRFFFDHHFTNCIYKENEPACVKILGPKTWEGAINLALGENDGGKETI